MKLEVYKLYIVADFFLWLTEDDFYRICSIKMYFQKNNTKTYFDSKYEHNITWERIQPDGKIDFIE